MIDEPYRWLEAISNRKEYVRDQLKGASPVFAASLADGILLLGVGCGQSKVFELFDRHAMAGLGHPADIEKIRQSVIDAAHMEGFTRAPEDVSLRRLVGFGLSPQMKAAFEQVLNAPFLAEVIFGELGKSPDQDTLLKVQFDGTYDSKHGGVFVATSQPEPESAAQEWLEPQINAKTKKNEAAELFLQAWWCLQHNEPFGDSIPPEQDRRAGWRSDLKDKTLEIGWLNRARLRPPHYESLDIQQLGLATE